MPAEGRKRSGGLWAVLAVLLFFASLQCLDVFLAENPFSSFLREHVESRTVDLRFRLRGPRIPPDDIVIVAVDEESLAEVGRWPWPRETVARLIDELSRGEPRIIGLDLFFPEPESETADAALGGAIARAGNVVMAAAFARGATEGLEAGRPLPFWLEDAALISNVTAEASTLTRAAAVLPTLEVIAGGALAHGHAVAELDDDAIVRSELLALGYEVEVESRLSGKTIRDIEVIPSFSLAVASRARGGDIPSYDELRGVVWGDSVLRTDPNGRALINYYGGTRTFLHIPASSVLSGAVPGQAIRDRIVYVGATGLQTFDPAPSPFDARLPGVEKNATVTANILRNEFLRRGGGLPELIIIVLGGLALSFVLFRVRAVVGAAFALSLLLLYLAAAQALFAAYRQVIGVVYPSLSLLAVYAVVTVSRYVAEERKAREIRALFQNYVSPKIVAELLKHPDRIEVGGIRKEITVMFSDVKGFTTFSEANSPEAVVVRLNEVLGAMSDIIFRWDGTLDKFVGDEIMAFWGAPMDQEDHAERAVRCALDMERKLDELALKWEREGIPVLRMGIGINSGEAVVGNIGVAGKKMDYTLIGDAVNTGARIETLTRKFGRDLLVAERTVERIGEAGDLEFTPLGTAPVKGRAEEVCVYGVSRRS